jgi:hypothetical protein|eukprot:SAG25_NODE_620_length_6411_cov_11.541350_8_plen_70_part_00
MCAWLDELQRGHHRSGVWVYFPNRDSDERGQSSGAVCATTDGGKWVGLVSALALRSHSRRGTNTKEPCI